MPAAAPKSRIVKLWSGKVHVALPRLATNPVRISPRIYRVTPKTSGRTRKYVIFVMSEALRGTEKRLSDAALRNYSAKTLTDLGYQVISVTRVGSTYIFNFRGISDAGVLPWQKVGPGVVRGMAKFVRKSNELAGSVLLCDPAQWNDPETGQFRRIVSTTRVLQ